MDLHNKFTGILLVINKNIIDQNEYATYKTEADKWLDNANKVIDKCNNIQNLDDINSNLNEINVSTVFFLFLFSFLSIDQILIFKSNYC